MRKLEYLDGIRGIMALNVIVCHFVCIYYPQMRFETIAIVSNDILTKFYTTPLSAFVNGNIAVQYFFVLTGFLTFRSVYQKSFTRKELGQKAVARYFRLWPMVFLATTFTLFTMVFHLQWHLLSTKYVANPSFLMNYCNFTPSLFNYLSNVLIMPFIKGSDYVGPFWTISYEMWGYVLCLIIAYSTNNTKWQRLLIVVVICVLYISNVLNYISFLLGGLVAAVYYCNDDERLFFEKIYDYLKLKPVLILLILIGVYFACCPLDFTSIYQFWAIIPRLNTSLLRAIGCSILIFCLLNCHALQKVFSIKPLIQLGGVSFAMYSIHWPIMLSLESGLFLLLYRYLGYNKSALLAFLITIPVIILVSIQLTKIEKNIYRNKGYKKIIDKVKAIV